MKRTHLSLILSLAMGLATLVALVAAQGPTPAPLVVDENILAVTPAPVVVPVTPAELDSSTTDAVLVTMPDGGAGVAVEIPANAKAEDALAIGEQAADTAEAVASGEITAAQGTRDPTETVDPGAKMLFHYLMIAAAAASRWALGIAVRRSPNLPNVAIGLISNGTLAAVVIGSFYLFHSSFPSAPQHLLMWCMEAGLGSMAGSMAQSGTDWRSGSQTSVPPLVPSGRGPIR